MIHSIFANQSFYPGHKIAVATDLQLAVDLSHGRDQVFQYTSFIHRSLVKQVPVFFILRSGFLEQRHIADQKIIATVLLPEGIDQSITNRITMEKGRYTDPLNKTPNTVYKGSCPHFFQFGKV